MHLLLKLTLLAAVVGACIIDLSSSEATGASKASKTHAQPVQQEESNQKMKDDTRKKSEIQRHNWSAHRTNVVEDVQVPDRILADDVAQNEEVFHLGGYKYTLEEATDACREIGGVLSSKSQQKEAFQQGASWCSWGWSTDGNGYFPNSMDFVGSPACGTPNNLEGPVTSDEFNRNEGLLGATCYGVKPSKESIPASANVKPFNRFLWSIYDKTA